MRNLIRGQFANAEQMLHSKVSAHLMSDKLQFVDCPLGSSHDKLKFVGRAHKKKRPRWPLHAAASAAGRSTIITPSSSSKSVSMTLMISLFFVGTCLPM